MKGMNAWNAPLLIIARSGMELSWRYAWALFLILAVTQMRFPILPAVCALAVASILTRFSAQKNWRVYQIVMLQTVGFFFCALLTLYPVHSQGFPFFSLGWIGEVFLGSKTPRQWFVLLLLLSCQLLIWRGGKTLVNGSKDHLSVCIQFDKGLGLFFLLLILKSLIELKGGLRIQNHTLSFLSLAFLIFSLVSIGLTRNQGPAKKSFLSGYHGIGVVLSVSIIAVVFGTGITLLIYPYLYDMADSLLFALGNVTQPMVPYLIWVILFIFKPKNFRRQDEIPDELEMGAGALSVPAVGGWQSLFSHIIGWGLVGLMGLLALAVLGLLLRYLLRLLLKKNSVEETEGPSTAWFSKLFNMLRLLPLRVWHILMAWVQDIDCAASVYVGMLHWGQHSGLEHLQSETPAEYGNRLKRHFPKLRPEIGMIVEAFNREIYGQIATGPDNLSSLRAARRKMKSLRHWPRRMKVWWSI